MTLAQASDWLIQQAAHIADWVRGVADRKAAAEQAFKLLLIARDGAQAALYGAQELADAFAARFSIPSFDSVKAKAARLVSGDKLWDGVLVELQRTIRAMWVGFPKTIGPGCFPAGTRVHTDMGLVRIEDLKVGDMVLSQPEQGGPQAYKRVAKTFVFEDKTLRALTYQQDNSEEYSTIFATGNHPFWAVEEQGYVGEDGEWISCQYVRGWTPAEDLLPDGTRCGQLDDGTVPEAYQDARHHHLIRMADGSLARLVASVPVYRTDKPGCGWVREIGQAPFEPDNSVDGFVRDFVNTGIIENAVCLDNAIYDSDDPYLKTCVYNIEVEDFHTYFIANGIWVHNTNCGEIGLADNLLNQLIGRRPLAETLVFDTDKQLAGYIKEGDLISDGLGLDQRLVVIKSKLGGIKNILEDGTQVLYRWLEFEDGVVGRLVSKANERYEYALIYKNAKLGGNDFIRVEGHLERNGTHYFVDRKYGGYDFVNAIRSNDAAQGMLDLLWRVSQAMEQNPGTKWIFEFPDRRVVTNDNVLKWVADTAKFVEKIRNDEVSFGKYISTELDGRIIREWRPDDDSAAKMALIKRMFGTSRADSRISFQTESEIRVVNQNVLAEGAVANVAPLGQADLDLVLPAARQYWSDAGALSAVLDRANIHIGSLPAGVAAWTNGTQITLSADGAGWGWYVDPNPADSSEFQATASANEFVAAPGSNAEGKLDLLTVLIHELGHVLGLSHAESAHDEMTVTVTPGLRRLPVVEPEELRAAGFATVVTAAPPVVRSLMVAAPQFAVVANPKLTNAEFNTGEAWATTGVVDFTSGAATLQENASNQTRLNQVFVVGEHDRFLSFTLAGTSTLAGNLQDEVAGPDDAIEVALLDANTGASLLGGTDLTRSDAFLNIQADGSEHAASGVSRVRNADGSTTYLVDLAGVPAGTVVNLSFDLIGFGATVATTQSRVTVRDLRLGVPQTKDDSVALAEDTATDIAALANDLNAAQPGFVPVVVAGPAHGTVSVNADGTFRYTPAPDWFGEDSFTYKLSDGRVDSNIATVSLTVAPVNDVPVAGNVTVTMAEDAAITGNLLAVAMDVDGDALSAVLVAGPQHGQLTLNADGSFSYTPNADWNGEDRFFFRVNDGALGSNVAEVVITVTPVNDAPVIAARTVALDEDVPQVVDLLASASDVDGDVLSVSITVAPQHGTLSRNADGSYTYMPDANYHGTDRVEYEVSDGTVAVPTSLTFVVRPVNDAPTAGNVAMTTAEDTAVTGHLLAAASDVDGDALGAVLVTGPQYGQLTLNADGSFSYTPNADWNGEDRFSFRVNDGARDSNVAEVVITVTPVNDAPVIAARTVELDEDVPQLVDLLVGASDVDGDALSVTITVAPQHGTLSRNADGSYTYTPDANYHGTDRVEYEVSDGTVAVPTSLTFVVRPVNDAPVAGNVAVTTAEDAALTGNLLAAASDVDGDVLSAVLVTGPQHGQLTLNADGSFRYTPNSDWNGEDRFSFRVNDGALDSNVAEVVITVTPVNDAPVVSPVAATLLEDGSLVLNLLATATDVDGDALSVRVGTPQHGRLQQNADGSYTYVPAADYNGEDGFSYSVSDGELESNTGWVRLTITAVNDAPVAQDDSVQLNEDSAIRLSLLSNDHDVDGDALRLVVEQQPAHGSLVVHDDNTVTYVPAVNWSGEDSFSYRVSDGELLSEPAVVRLVVNAVADAPTLVLTEQPGASRELFRTDWESVCDVNYSSTLVRERELEGWTVITRPDHSWGGQHGFEIWSEGDRMANPRGRPQTVHAAAGDGRNWLELNDAKGLGHQTLGIERGIETVAGASYTLSLDYAGRLGYGADYTRIGIYVDGQLIGSYAASSPDTALDWQALSFRFTGKGGVQTIRIVTEATRVDANGRGAMIDDIALTETLPANTGWEDGAVPLSALSAALVDTDGSETLHLSIAALPVGSTLTDGTRSFVATADQTTADVTGWNLGRLSLIPPQNLNGTLALRVIATTTEQANGEQARTEAALTVTVLAVNDAPEARNASYTVPVGGSVRIDFAQLVSDVDGDPLSLSLCQPRWGRLSRNADGSYTYTPHWGYRGTDSFSYTVSDGKARTMATVTLNVVRPGDTDGCHHDNGNHTGFDHSGHYGYGDCDDRSACITVQASASSRTELGHFMASSQLRVDWSGSAAFLPATKTNDNDWLLDLLGGGSDDEDDLAKKTGLVVKVKK